MPISRDVGDSAKEPDGPMWTAGEMLESFRMQTGGKEYRRLVGAVERMFGVTIFFGTDTLSGRATIL